MTAIIMRNKAAELKGMIEQGLHIFGKCMNIAEQMCEGEMGERGSYGMRGMDYPYGDRYGMHEGYYPPQYPMGERWEAYGDRRGVPGTGRYSRY